jgi:single-strand DNA-binding protein
MLNKACLIGNLGRDPEIRSMQNGNRVANLSLATTDTWKDKQTGERRQATEWHRIVIFNDHLVSVVEKFCKKGDKLYIEGKIKTRKWTDQQGVEKYSTEIVMESYGGMVELLGGSGGSDEDENQDQDYSRGKPAGRTTGAGYTPPGNDLDDDIPF